MKYLTVGLSLFGKGSLSVSYCIGISDNTFDNFARARRDVLKLMLCPSCPITIYKGVHDEDKIFLKACGDSY